jgi:hypothetical protein
LAESNLILHLARKAQAVKNYQTWVFFGDLFGEQEHWVKSSF